MREVDGQPLHAGAGAVPPQRLAEYVAFQGQVWNSGQPARADHLVEMATTNALWLCGDQAASKIEQIVPTPEVAAVRVDGRHYPHEWVGTATAAIKTDGVEHHDDYFFPGPVDIAWDLAGALEEWRLAGAAERTFVDHYVTCSGDKSIGERLPFYRAAYLAFRGGYATFARDQLQNTRDGERFGRARDHYAARLSQVLSV
jgi:hypothetical protein